ncbi:MAG: Rne/Rng family ribonuclease [Pirellulaceae bacterium]
MRKEMLINVSQPEECRIAILEDGVLEELYTERASQNNYAGNIYKGKIVNLEPSIQAAFVDFGVGRNGFLHISDVEPQYFRQAGYDPEEIMDGNVPGADIDDGDDADDDGDRPKRRGNGRHMRSTRPRFKPPIQEIFRRGDEVLVQVIKEGIGSKGPTLSTYISIPGRYLVLMPALGRVGVSRKIEDDKKRRVLRNMLLDLNPPKGLGFIVRTAGQDRTQRELSRDMAYLLRLWKVLVKRVKNTPGPCDIYEESDMIIRTIRDIFSEDIDTILVDEQGAHDRAKEFLQFVMPRYVARLKYYDGREPLFHKYNLEKEIAKIQRRTVPLKGGGSIVIDPTEALVAIDVNSGSFRTDDSAEDSAFQLNMVASKEIARQLRLRDLGGVIVNDFIDMRRESHRRRVERSLADAMRRDRARTKILRTSPFGLIEMTRQRIRPSLKRSVYEDCPCCQGRAVVKTGESMAIEVVRVLMMACQQPRASRITIRVNDKVSAYLNNRKRKDVMQIEESTGVAIQILGSEALFPEHFECDCRDNEGNLIPLPFLEEA